MMRETTFVVVLFQHTNETTLIVHLLELHSGTTVRLSHLSEKEGQLSSPAGCCLHLVQAVQTRFMYHNIDAVSCV